MKDVLLITVVLIVSVVALYWRKYRCALAEDRAELDKAIWEVIARLSHDRESLLKTILKCDFIGIFDGRK
jgi:hypothetical protein